jgi:hypothetical protein
MAEFKLNIFIPDDKVTAVIDGIARQNGWTDTVEDENDDVIPNPVSKLQYIKNHHRDVLRASWKAWNDEKAVSTALGDQPEDGSDFI